MRGKISHPRSGRIRYAVLPRSDAGATCTPPRSEREPLAVPPAIRQQAACSPPVLGRRTPYESSAIKTTAVCPIKPRGARRDSIGGTEARRQGVRGRVPPVRQVRSKRENSFPQKSGKSFRRFDRVFPGADAEDVRRTRPRVQGNKPCRGRVSGGGEQPLPTKNAPPCIPPSAVCRTTPGFAFPAYTPRSSVSPS